MSQAKSAKKPATKKKPAAKRATKQAAANGAGPPASKIELAPLAGALKSVAPAVDARSLNKMLAAVRVRTLKNAIELSTTDGRWRIESTIARTGSGDFDLCLPHKALARAVGAAQGAAAELLFDGSETLVLRQAKREISLRASEGDQQSDSLEPDQIELIGVFEPEALEDVLGHAVSCASDDETRPLINAVAVEVRAGQLALVATDSYRLVYLPLEAEELKIDELGSLPFARAQAKALARDIKAQKPEEVRLSRFDGGLVFEYASTRWICPVVEGAYPDWEKIAPEKNPNLALDSVELKRTLKSVKALMGETSSKAAHGSDKAFVLELAPERISVRFKSADVGELTEELEKSSWQGESLKMAVNPNFLADTLEILGPELEASVTDPTRPLRFDGVDGGVVTLMPIRLTDLRARS